MTGYSGLTFGSTNLELIDVNVRALRMNPVVRDAWTTALESGDYQQGQGVLYAELEYTTVDGTLSFTPVFCCLGVLCDLAAKAGAIRLSADRTVYETPDGPYDHDRCGGTLPEAVARWAGLWDADPYVNLPDGRFSLTNCNDNLGLTFPEIAQAIRTSL